MNILRNVKDKAPAVGAVDAVGKAANKVSDGVQTVVEDTTKDAVQEVQDTLSKLLASKVPSPVPGCEWSIVNAMDSNFDGFSSTHLSDFLNLLQQSNVNPASLASTTITVARDIGLVAKLNYEAYPLIEYVVKQWKMEINPSLFFSFGDLQAYVIYDEHNICLSFRGTEALNLQDWAVDAKFIFTSMKATSGDGASLPDEAAAARKISVHYGFYNSLGLSDKHEGISAYLEICSAIQKLRANTLKKIWITGHSMGAALASLFTAQLVLDDNEELLKNIGGVFTYGQPRCGDQAYASFVDEWVNGTVNKALMHRVVNYKDIVCTVPLELMQYVHHTNELLLSPEVISVICNGTKIERVPTGYEPLPIDSEIKKIVLQLLPHMLEDHFSCEYVRNIQKFM